MQTEKFESSLLAKRDELTKRLAAIKNDFANGRSADYADQVTETENDDVLKNLEFEATQEIHQINQALQRIKAGNFGSCEKCGVEISEARLNAVPFTANCQNCAE